VIGWGSNVSGETTVPPLPPGVTYVGIAAEESLGVAVRSDGAVVTWRSPALGPTPPLPPGTSYVRVAAGVRHVLALRSDGEVVGWGSPLASGATTLPALPPGLRYVAIAAGDDHSVALRSDGALVSVGSPGYGQSLLSPLPLGKSIREIAEGGTEIVLLLGPAPVCQPSLGFEGPGTARASLCGSGLGPDEGSVYAIEGAPRFAPGALAISLPGYPNVPFRGGTLASFGGFRLLAPLVADPNGVVNLPIAGGAEPLDVVLQSAFVTPTLPGGVAFTNAILAHRGP